jgi:hypothetical protein
MSIRSDSGTRVALSPIPYFGGAMTLPNATLATDLRRDPLAYATPEGASASAVSWAAIFAGAAAAAALSLILLILGTGLGLSSLSPWANEGASAKALGVSTILWVTFMQLAASAMGGYIAGRLRTKWVGLHTDEVAFRDTAHGFLAWGVATLFTAWLLSSTLTSIVSSGVQAGASVAGGAASAATAAAAGGAAAAGADASKSGGDSGPMGYFVDSLFRSSKGGARSASGASSEASTAEVTRIFTNAAAAGKLPEEDARYVGQVVAQRTGMSQQDAEKRVNETFSQMQAKKQQAETAAREAADKARKAAALGALWLFISLLIGAFVASLCATYGGVRRDA